MASNGCIAVLNAGSSSIKFALYEDIGQDAIFRGQIEQIGVSPRLKVANASGETVIERNWPAADLDHRAATRCSRDSPRPAPGPAASAVGHRVVHGGTKYAAPIRTDPEVMARSRWRRWRLLHQLHNLVRSQTIAELIPQMPQVACFDTAFHRSQPPLAQLFGLPRKFTDAGVRRYGFHGLSYEYVAGRLGEVAPELTAARVVIAHLGNGASLCAVRQGRSVASTMGFTAVDGLVMGTRCGAIDPGVLIYLMDAYGMDARAIEALIYRQSGLLGGVSRPTCAPCGRRPSLQPPRRCLFVYRIVRRSGPAAALGGLDGLVLTGGIGEHDVATRAGSPLPLAGPELTKRAASVSASAATLHVSAWSSARTRNA